MAKILIVEDERVLAEALQTKLKDAGLDVEIAVNGEEGLVKLAANKFDLILLDIIMPVMDGITMLKKLKENDETKNIPVIILSNLSDDQVLGEQLVAGGTEYLVKSDYSLDDVLTIVKNKINLS